MSIPKDSFISQKLSYPISDTSSSPLEEVIESSPLKEVKMHRVIVLSSLKIVFKSFQDCVHFQAYNQTFQHGSFAIILITGSIHS